MPSRSGTELLLNDERPNGELLLATGLVQEANSSDFLEWPATLLQSDKYYMMKGQILESMGFGPNERFPVYADRMPIQLLAYLRLARIGDPALLAKVSFDKDVELSQIMRPLKAGAVFSEAAFCRAFSVVVGHACFLPAANVFALLPLASSMGRTGNGNGCDIDFDAERNAVIVTAKRGFRTSATRQRGMHAPEYRDGAATLGASAGSFGAVVASPSTTPLPLPVRPMLEASGSSANTLAAGRKQAWPTTTLKARQKAASLNTAAEGMEEGEGGGRILESMGFGPNERFPVYADRMPIQLLAYLRLARIGDPALLAKVSFDKDVELSQMNEYEILQILMGDCRERLAVYTKSYEEDVKIAQQPALSPRERLAVKLRLGEKRIINATMDAVRRRLAPIRGIPTKSGAMLDPNSDFKEMFDLLESIPMAPVKLFQGLASWARGEQDPDWGKKPGQGRGPAGKK
ncbi:hypothetical protein TSOC_000234 [Tetrabaena socialis]|uniref:Rubisco LSMT substrate-binding domain-containing protein n=1 Tax=Tetrabaena socialis TaxID=47790 RepID=A0A2J8AJX5_9CHLO|nr:hypothetical protein TSOC_000234 [Tetrabaena socialis]|eukprot:PNH12803.1 hypothetical protein TSOC_000234 [Tetrabaena socialis]